jgi:tyrosyl-DNA phosphodiesterase 2
LCSVSRTKLILSHILDGLKSPDIIFLQEVTPDVRAPLLDNARVRAAFFVTDAKDETSFEGVPFVTMTLLSSFASDLDSQKEGDRGKLMLGCVSRMTLPSKYRRDGLYVDIIPPTAPGTVLLLVNVHLDSLSDALPYCAQQIKMLADALDA